MYTLLIPSLGITQQPAIFKNAIKTVKEKDLACYEACCITSYKLSVVKI
jgi:hypothetical protein